MVSNALSSRRRYLRRPKVCKSDPNPGRCHPPPPPPPPPPPVTCPPDVITGFFELTGNEWCVGPSHHWDFVCPRVPPAVDPWYYLLIRPGSPPGEVILMRLWQTPIPKLYVYPQYWENFMFECHGGERANIPVVWCEHQSIVVDVWDWTHDDEPIHLEVNW